MNKWSLFIVASLMLVGLTELLSSPLQSQVSSPYSPPMYGSGPVTDYQLALSNSGDVVQFRRGERYNVPDPSVPELGENSEATIWDSPPSHFKKDPTPFAASDVVVVGVVTAGRSHFSHDRRNIYSEFKITIKEILKNSSALPPQRLA